MSKPTHKQIHAVQKALYKHARLEKLANLAQEIGVLMNLDPYATLSPDDVRNPPGSGPQWIYPDTGQVDQNVLLAADRCDEVATTLLQIHNDLAGVDFPATDKQHLMTALKQEAASWTARGALWRAPSQPSDVDQAVAPISNHFEAAMQAVKPVERYLKPENEVLG